MARLCTTGFLIAAWALLILDLAKPGQFLFANPVDLLRPRIEDLKTRD